MRILLLLFIALTLNTQAQPETGNCYFARKKGLILGHSLILVPGSSRTYILESYLSGAGFFNGFPVYDTLTIYKGRLLSSMKAITFRKNKIIINQRGLKKRYRFRELNECDPLVNVVRNRALRENIRYSMRDKKMAGEFKALTEPLLHTLCFDVFVKRTKEILQEINEKSRILNI